MKELRELFRKVLNHIGITGSEVDDISKTFFNQVYAIFVEATLRKQLPPETFKKRVAEYQAYIKDSKHELVHKDISHYTTDDSGKVFAAAFLKHLKFFIYGLKEKGDISQQQVKEVGELIKTHIQNRKKVQEVNEAKEHQGGEPNQAALNSLAQ